MTRSTNVPSIPGDQLEQPHENAPQNPTVRMQPVSETILPSHSVEPPPNLGAQHREDLFLSPVSR